MIEEEMDAIVGQHMDPWNMWVPIDKVLVKMYTKMKGMTYRGIRTHKFPVDAWAYQEIISALRPSVIIELGNQYGGSALYLRDMMNFGTTGGLVVGVDKDHSLLDPRIGGVDGIAWVEGDTEDPEVVNKVRNLASHHPGPCVVIDDAAHTVKNVYKNLCNYSDLVSVGSFYVVEDTIDNFCVKHANESIDPYGGIQRFMGETQDFEIERRMEMLYLTFNPKGYLRRVR